MKKSNSKFLVKASAAYNKHKPKYQKTGTVFQAYVNKYNANPSDTLVGNDPRGITKFGWGDKSQNNALATAFEKTYGKTRGSDLVGEGSAAEKAARIPQSKKTVKRYTKDLKTPQNFRSAELYKKGGSTKAKMKTGGCMDCKKKK